MLILYASARHDYGRPELGLSFEHFNFFDSLRSLGHEMIYLDSMGVMKKRGKRGMNDLLRELVKKHGPAMLFTSVFDDEFDPQVISDISREGKTQTLNWFCDDHWRFDDFSQRWAPHFSWVVTTAHSAVEKYRRIGYSNAIHSQWACNPNIYARLDRPLGMDVTFVGQPHGDRKAIIASLGEQGIRVETFGRDWPSGRITQERMVEIFNESRINLNLSNTAMYSKQRATKAGLMLRKLLPHAVQESRPFVSVVRAVEGARRMMPNAAKANTEQGRSTVPGATEKQIKGRNFEVPGCGGFLLTEEVAHLEEYYDLGSEVACYASTEELVDKIRFYLSHEKDRLAIATAGYRRTMAHHTYAHRFGEIFAKMGLDPGVATASPSVMEVFE